MILGLEGETGSGKSALLYTAPLPLVVFAFDAGADRALYGTRWKQYEGIDVQVLQYPHDTTDIPAHQRNWQRNGGRAITIYLLPTPIQLGSRVNGMRKLWNTFTILATAAVMDDNVKSVGADTMTLARRVAADAHLETLQNDPKTAGRVQLIQIEYGRPNDAVRSVYSTAQNKVESLLAEGRQKHFIVTHHLEEVRREYPGADGEVKSVIVTEGPKNTPVKQLSGLGNSYNYMDVAIRIYQDEVPNFLDANKRDTVIMAKFMKCGYDLSLKGTSLQSPTWDSLATHINSRIHPHSHIELRDKVGSDGAA